MERDQRATALGALGVLTDLRPERRELTSLRIAQDEAGIAVARLLALDALNPNFFLHEDVVPEARSRSRSGQRGLTPLRVSWHRSDISGRLAACPMPRT